MSSSARFESLEQLRSRASELLAAQRCRYAGKPLPLADDERHAWEEQVALWQALYFGYAMCTDAAGEADLTALVWLRSLDSLGRAIREYARAYRAVPAALWKELNSCYRAAESCGLESTEVPVQGRAGASESCRTIYLVTVLHEAANVYALSAAQMHALERWLPDWARSIDLLPAAPAASRSPLVCVARGSMPYSAVIQPRPLPRRNGGTCASTLAVQSTLVSPNATSTEPSACRV